MKIVNRISARSLWFFQTEDLNPRGLDLPPIYSAIKSRYRFGSYKARDPSSPGAQHMFFGGAFSIKDAQSIEILECTIFEELRRWDRG